MTNKFELRSLVLLLTVSSLLSGRRLLAVEVHDQQNATVSNYTSQQNNATELQPTSGPSLHTGLKEELSSAVPPPDQYTSSMAHSQPSQGNGTFGHLFNIDGTERNSTQHQSKGNESFAGTESPSQTLFPVKNVSSITTTQSLPLTASVGPKNGTNTTNSVPVVVTLVPHVSTDEPSGSRTTEKPLVPSTTVIRTTQRHMPTKPRSTQTTTTKVCPTAETKGDSLVSQCLIVIASLAALATIFIMTTVVLATKLAGLRYRHRRSLLHETEMVCISALMNDSDHPIPAPRRPKSNGALLPAAKDEDGDDLTLNSFLHDTEGTA